MVHMLSKETITAIIEDNYSRNSFVQLCDIKFDDVKCGEVCLSMLIDDEKHTNMYSVVHGGALASLADTALGAACASVGARAVTLEYSIKFVSNLHAGDKATAIGTVLKRGHKIITVRVETFNKAGDLLTEVTGTMFAIGSFDGIPEKW